MFVGSVGKEGPMLLVCRTYITKGIFMRWNTHRIEMVYRNYVSGYTAYCNAYTHPLFCAFCRKSSERCIQPEEHSPGRAVLQKRSLNAYQATDYPQLCGIGRLFCFPGNIPRCRSPPYKLAASILFVRICKERKFTYEYRYEETGYRTLRNVS